MCNVSRQKGYAGEKLVALQDVADEKVGRKIDESNAEQ